MYVIYDPWCAQRLLGILCALLVNPVQKRAKDQTLLTVFSFPVPIRQL